MKKTIRTRCTEINLKPIKEKALLGLINAVLKKENKNIDKAIIEKIIEHSDNSARKALVLLDAIIDMEEDVDMMEAIEGATQEKAAVELCRLLLRKAKWSEIASMLKELQGEEAESLRRMMLGYMRSCLLSNSKITPRAYYIMTCFEQNFFNTGHPGLAMACWESIGSK